MTATLGSLCSFLSGGTPSKKVSRYYTGSIPWITGADIDGPLVTTARSFITEEAIEKSATKLVPKGTVLLVTRTSVGKVAVTGAPLCFSQDVTALIPDESELDVSYLVHFLRTKQPHFERIARGATIKGITRRAVTETSIPLPPLPEQKRIAAILDKADALRTKRQAALAKLDELTQSIFLEMFGDPVINPKEWASVPLSECFHLRNGVNFSSIQRGRGLPVVDVRNMYSDDVYLKTDDLYRVDLELDHSRLLEVDDLLFVRSSVKREGVAWPALFPGLPEPATYCGFLIRATPIIGAPSFEMRYLVHYLRHENIRSQLISSAGQVAITNINQERLGALKLLTPPRHLQDTFGEKIRKIESIRQDELGSTTYLDQLFSSLQHRAFSGAL